MASGIATLLGFRGQKPKVPKWLDVDPTEEQRLATEGNLENLTALTELGGRTSEALAAQWLAAMEKASPGFGATNQKLLENIQRMASGELPRDVENLVNRRAAEAGVVSGTSGSDFDKYRSLRNLGLTSLDVSGKALDSFSRWMASVGAGVPQFNFASMFVTPQQRIQSTFANRENKFNRDWIANQIKALPSNEEMAYAQILDYVSSFATMAAGMGLQSAMGGGGAGAGRGTGADEWGKVGTNYYDAAQRAAMNRPLSGAERLY